MVVLAGPVAEARLTGRPLDEVLAGSGMADSAEFDRLVKASPEGRRCAFRRDALEGAERMVAMNWPAITNEDEPPVRRSRRRWSSP